MPFLTAVYHKMHKYGFNRRVAVLATRIERGVDSLPQVAEWLNLRQSEYITIKQYLEAQGG